MLKSDKNIAATNLKFNLPFAERYLKGDCSVLSNPGTNVAESMRNGLVGCNGGRQSKELHRAIISRLQPGSGGGVI